MENTAAQTQPEQTASEAFAARAGWIFREVREAHQAGANPEDEAERLGSITSDEAGRYLAAAAIVQVWQLDDDDATEVRHILRKWSHRLTGNRYGKSSTTSG